MVHARRLECRRRMAGIAGVRRRDMADLFALGRRSIVAGRACADHLRMIDFGDRLESRRVMASLAGNRRCNMRCRLALGLRAIVT